MATYNSFSGTDIHAVFGDTVFGDLQMVSYKSDREKAPVYTMGSPDPRTIARNKRLITGGCVFVVFDQDALLDSMRVEAQQNAERQVYLTKGDRANYTRSGIQESMKKAIYQGGSVDTTGLTNISTAGNQATISTQLVEAGAPMLAEQIRPFDITLVGANEYGTSSRMVIHGVELMTEAGGVQVDDMVLEKQMSFIARRITPWTKL